jgi:hypothetical protein
MDTLSLGQRTQAKALYSRLACLCGRILHIFTPYRLQSQVRSDEEKAELLSLFPPILNIHNL